MPSPTQIWGFERERTAERALIEAGYVIVARNWRGAGGEVDRIGWDGDVLCFIEVRARSTAAFGLPCETVKSAKQRRICAAAMAYLAKTRKSANVMARFDVVSIVDVGIGCPDVTILRNAFDAGF